jgi:hypothetical protein
MPILVLGNKVDLAADEHAMEEPARDFCRPLGLRYLPTSARTGLNVEVAFRELALGALRTFALLGSEAE